MVRALKEGPCIPRRMGSLAPLPNEQPVLNNEPTAQLAGLLARETVVAYGPQARELIKGRCVLVTGAGGSIGSELVRQLCALNPEIIYLLDHDESLMHSVQLELYDHGLLDNERTVLADIRDGHRLERIFCDLRPELVFHAAALKHLPILERYPSEAVRTNVLGTRNVLLASQACGAERLTLVSTDKAANPSSVLGATKRLAEILTSLAATDGLRTASVRFGNVLGSRGSFLFTLAHQIRCGIPVTITHPDAARFFMTIPEAASLVIEAAEQADRGETYVLDMGSQVRIRDLVNRFAALTGYGEPQVRFIGLLPGEKVTEELFSDSEMQLGTRHQKIWKVPSADASYVSLDRLASLYRHSELSEEDAVRTDLWACLSPSVLGSKSADIDVVPV